MRLITLDFESFFDSEFTLKKLSTESYCRDARFKAHMVGLKYDRGPTSDYLPHLLGNNEGLRRDIETSAVLCHHAHFDGLILSHVYDLRPAFWFDTLSMARLALPRLRSHSLESLAAYFGLPSKTVPYNLFRGVQTLGPDLYRQVAEGCRHDVDLTREIFDRLLPYCPKDELRVIDQTVRMFTEPVLRLDRPRLKAFHAAEVVRKEELMFDVGASLGVPDHLGDDAYLAAVETELQSSAKFKQALAAIGYECPMKPSPTGNGDIPALAKTDDGMKELLEHDDGRVSALAGARLGVKSTIDETRASRLLDAGTRGALPVYLAYGAAKTLRFGGGDKSNWQNFRRGGEIRASIQAPEGHQLVIVDAAQVECRGVNWQAGQTDVLDLFRSGRDVYCEAASRFYQRTITKEDKHERFQFKTVELGCFGPTTKVLTDNGVKPIVEITEKDRLWDGIEWVTHRGVMIRGERSVITLAGLSVTPEHLILLGNTWREAQSLQNENFLFQALATGSENLPYPVTRWGVGADSCRFSYGALVEPPNIRSTSITSFVERLRGVINALKKPLGIGPNGITAMPTWFQMRRIAYDYLTEFRRSLTDVIIQATGGGETMGVEGLGFMTCGALIDAPSSRISSPSPVGIIRDLILIGSKTIKDISLKICGLFHAGITQKIAEPSESSNNVSTSSPQKMMTYDIAFSGPRNRYTVVSDAGPLIAHNCGYGLGWRKYQRQMRAGMLGGPSVILADGEAQTLVSNYRYNHPAVTAYWKQAGGVLATLARGEEAQWGVLEIADNRIYLPNDAPLNYEGLYWGYYDPGEPVPNEEPQWWHPGRKGRVKYYGGKLVENVTQALWSGLFIREKMVAIGARYRIVLQVHDEIVFVAPTAEAPAALAWALGVMRTPPAWAPDVPLDADGLCAPNYAK